MSSSQRKSKPSCSRNLSVLVLVAAALVACAPSGDRPPAAGSPPGSTEPAGEWALAIHGGAGVISKEMPEAEKQAYFDALEAALALGRDMLEDGAAALDVVEAVVAFLEDDPKFNAGRGAVYTHEGTHELDAMIMDGRSHDLGAVAAVRRVKSPIRLARGVLERSPHVFLIGEGAEVFAEELGLEMVDNAYFDTERRYQQLQDALAEEAAAEIAHAREQAASARPEGAPGLVDPADPVDPVGDRAPSDMDTVGAAARDRHGNLAAATSTGGMTNKRFGRVGDVPVAGAGTWADNATCALSGTGKGEQFIRHQVTGRISALVEIGGLTCAEAARQVIQDILDPGDGGVIGVSRAGEIVWEFNSPGMFRGAADSGGRFDVAIWEAEAPAEN